MTSLSLRQIEYLVAVVDEGRLTWAARRLHVTEPTLSQQLKTLERSVGAQLLIRGADGVRPTPAGAAFLPYGRAALRSSAEACAAARSADGQRQVPVRLDTLPSLLPGLLPALAHWSRAWPEVCLAVSVQSSREVLQERVVAGAADMAIGPRPMDWNGPVLSLGEEEVLVVCSIDEPLWGGACAAEELLRRRWVRYPEAGWAPADLVRGQGEAVSGARPGPVDVPSVAEAVELAARGVGLTAVPASAVPDRLRSQTIRLAPRQARETTLYRAPNAEEGIARHFATLGSSVAHAERGDQKEAPSGPSGRRAQSPRLTRPEREDPHRRPRPYGAE
ncbi:LysR family transcriptional regulator [Streptomyces sp. cg36]|uniref:LysR family transcriptional regulator n=1 Tax=Streptomyces sp. cg36 TaxID=3238798 RepID=UPI0034E21450